MLFKKLKARGFQAEFVSHAEAILTIDFPEAVQELETVLEALTIPAEKLVRSGGGETETTQGLRRELAAYGWVKHNFEVKKLIDGIERESISHEVDHVRTFPKGKVAMEIEWNNKDPFFDRDLENFKRLHADAAISLGIILTRGKSLQDNIPSIIRKFIQEHKVTSHEEANRMFDLERTRRQIASVDQRVQSGSSFAEAWADVFCSDKFGQATTHWRKLEDRLHRGVGNPCPLLLIGIPDSVVTF